MEIIRRDIEIFSNFRQFYAPRKKEKKKRRRGGERERETERERLGGSDDDAHAPRLLVINNNNNNFNNFNNFNDDKKSKIFMLIIKLFFAAHCFVVVGGVPASVHAATRLFQWEPCIGTERGEAVSGAKKRATGMRGGIEAAECPCNGIDIEDANGSSDGHRTSQGQLARAGV